MKNKIFLLIAIPCAIASGCKQGPCADVLIKKDTTDALERKNHLFAFVGELIEMKGVPHIEDSSFYKGAARYKILQRIYGCYAGDTIQFTVRESNWPFQFHKFKNALLYVLKKDSGYEFDHYLYDDVYMTRTGHWAGPFKTDWSDEYVKYNIIPKRVDFTNPVIFPLDTVILDDSEDYEPGDELNFPHPFYHTVGKKAIAQYGIYVEDLFKLKKQALLSKMRLFTERKVRDGQKTITLEAVEVELEEAPPPEIQDRRAIQVYWEKFAKWIVQNDTVKIKQALCDSLWVCGSLFTKQRFIRECFRKIFAHVSDIQLKRGEFGYYTPVRTELKDFITSIRHQVVKEKDNYWLRQISLYYIMENGDYTTLHLSFIRIRNGFRLYDIRFAPMRSCCF